MYGIEWIICSYFDIHLEKDRALFIAPSLTEWLIWIGKYEARRAMAIPSCETVECEECKRELIPEYLEDGRLLCNHCHTMSFLRYKK